MPYTEKQCRFFYAASKGKITRGKNRKAVKPPSDFRKHCKGKARGKGMRK